LGDVFLPPGWLSSQILQDRNYHRDHLLAPAFQKQPTTQFQEMEPHRKGALKYLPRAKLTSPTIDVSEQVTVNRLEVGEIETARHSYCCKFEQAGYRRVRLEGSKCNGIAGYR
jgi:hypothetical protein